MSSLAFFFPSSTRPSTALFLKPPFIWNITTILHWLLTLPFLKILLPYPFFNNITFFPPPSFQVCLRFLHDYFQVSYSWPGCYIGDESFVLFRFGGTWLPISLSLEILILVFWQTFLMDFYLFIGWLYTTKCIFQSKIMQNYAHVCVHINLYHWMLWVLA